MSDYHAIRRAVLADAEAVPLPNLRPLAARIRAGGPRRLGAIGELVKQNPGDETVAEFYLEELLARSQRQVKGQQCLYKTFVKRVDAIEDDVWQALPQAARQSLKALVRLARETPIPVSDPRLLAHAVTVDGELSAWLRHSEWRDVLGVHTNAGHDEVEQAYRRLRREHHPDHGGDASRFRQTQDAWEQARQELGNEQ